MPSSLASEANLDSVLDAMAQSGFPTEIMRAHLESTSREIVDTIVESMDMLSSQRKKRSKSGFPSVVGNIFQTINEMVRKFIHLSKQAVKESSTELLSVDEDLRLQKQTEVDSRADEVIQNIVDPFQKEVPLNKSNSSENHEASPSSDQRNGRIEDSSHSTPDLKECEGNVLTAKSERFLSKATQVVSDLLVRSDRCSTSTSTGSSKEIHDAAVNIAETVAEALDKLVESSVIDSQSDSEAIIRSLEASTHTLNRSDISEGRVPSTSLFRRVRGYVQALFTSLKPDEQTAASIQEAPVSDLQRSKDHTVSQLDDLTITCTNNIIGEIVQLYHSAESESQSHVPAGDDECEAIHGIIQGLEELVKASSLSSKRASSGRDLGDRMDRSFSNLDSALKASSLAHAASSIHSAQRLFSAEFGNEVIVKIVELYKSELLLPKPSPSTLPQISHSMGLLSTFPSGHGSDEEDKVSKISSSASRQTSIRMITVKTKGIVNEAVQKVSHIALQRAAPKIAWDELSQCSLASTRGTSATPVLSVSSTDSDNAAPATTVVDATDKTPVLSSSDSECSVVTVVKTVVDALDSGRSIKSIPLSSDMSDLKSEITASGIRQKPPQDDAQVYEAQYVWNEHKVRLDSCTDEIISKIVDLYCSEVSDVLSKESIQKLTSDSFRVLSKHLVHDALWKFVVPLPAEEPMNMPSATSADSDVLFRRSRLMKRLNFSACEIGSYVCTAFQGFLGSLHKSEDITSDSVRLFAQFRLFRGVRRKVTEVFSLLSTSDKSDISSTTNETEKYTVWTKSTRSTTPQRKPDSIYSSAVSERSSNQENGVILKKPSSAAEEITQHQFQRPSATNQLTPLITDEPTCFHEVGLRKCLGSRPGPSQACRSTSDSVMETWARNLLRDPIQVPLALVYPFVEESVKSLLLHCLSQNPALPNVTSPDQDMQGTSASFESQSRNSNKSTGFQCVSTKALDKPVKPVRPRPS
ncbi:hypothetical protein SRHO_G00021750 [Serrasalmus rhombeus]